MAKRRVKKRTHISAKGQSAGRTTVKPGERIPKSMVIRIGASEVGSSVSQLVRDVRDIMEPYTATRLRERRSNRLKDYTSMAGPLGVSHLLLFSKSSSGNTNMRLTLTPRGPTLHFRVEKFSLCKDVHRSMKRPKTGVNDHVTPPLLVMNNFSTKPNDSKEQQEQEKIPKHLESLTTAVFQSLFPPINPTTTPLSGIKRVLLLDRISESPEPDRASYVLNLRHYAIETKTAKSVPQPLRRLDAAEKLTHVDHKRKRNGLPNLGKLGDVADYLLEPHTADGFTSGSESEPETDAEVEILAQAAQKVQRKAPRSAGEEQKATRRQAPRVERKGIKLHEIGPRLKLRLTKVEEGLCAGKVMWHEYIHKSKEELREMEKIHEQRRQEKERRRAEQKANVQRKEEEKAARKARGESVDENEVDEEEEYDEDLDDDEWYDQDEMEVEGAGNADDMDVDSEQQAG